jgi:ribosomal protein S18 acetylase RimI-like enzyme
MSVHSRLFASEHDYSQMRQLVTEHVALTGARNYATPGDLDWWRFPHDDQGEISNALLWFDDSERLVGFAWPSESQVDLVVDTAHTHLQDEMLAWAEEFRSATPADGDAAPTLTAWAFEQDDTRNALLARRGYDPTDFVFCHRERRLDTPLPIPKPELPAGYTLDHMHDEYIESRAAAQRDAFQSTKMTATRYRRLKQAPTYRPELDLIVRDPDGEVAAFATLWFDAANRTGTFEPVGTRHAQQRRGLARALLHEGMHRLAALGATTALVLSREGEPSNHLYDAAGLQPVGRNVGWKKRLLDSRV